MTKLNIAVIADYKPDFEPHPQLWMALRHSGEALGAHVRQSGWSPGLSRDTRSSLAPDPAPQATNNRHSRVRELTGGKPTPRLQCSALHGAS